jgi:upstream activation factor subunit UAF30
MPAKTKRTTTRSKVKSKVRAVPDISELLEDSTASQSAVASETAPTTSRRRAKPTRESVDQLFISFLERLDAECVQSKENKQRKVSARTWRSLAKEAKALHNQSLKLMKKTKTTGSSNGSGFMKPVRISKEMAKFTGWDVSEPKSRVDVTKFLCKYIKDNDLQNPEDRRQILADKKLAKLLNYDLAKDGVPLTYFYLQKKIQAHFAPSTK